MDFSKALACAALAFVLTDALKRIVPFKLTASLTQILALVVGIATVFLVGATVWAHQQVIGGHTLDTLNFGSKVVAGLIVGGGATIFDRFSFFSSREATAQSE